MNLFKTILVAVVATLALARADLALGQNLIVDGNFDYDTTNWTLAPEWSTSGNQGNSGPGTMTTGVTVAPGYWFVAGNAGSEGSLSQSITTTPEAKYVFSLSLVNITTGPPNNFTAQAGDFTLATYTNAGAFGGNAESLDPVLLSGTFTATSSQTNILFSFQNDSGFWYFNNISVLEAEAVPEPLTWVMLVGGFGFLLMLRRRRWN